MIKYIAVLILLFDTLLLSGQIGINTEDVHPSAALEVYATDKGILLPRVTLLGTKDVVTIVAPATGLLVFNTKAAPGGGALGDKMEANNVYYWSGSEWALLIHSLIIKEVVKQKTDELKIPKPAVYEVANDIPNFLLTEDVGYAVRVPMREVVNSIPEYISFNTTNNRLTFQPGTYNISLVYEATHNATGCTLSSYYCDLLRYYPADMGGGAGPGFRIHSTSSHTEGGLSNHGGTIAATIVVTTPMIWTIQMGRGQSGNCHLKAGNTLAARSTHLTILRMGD
ncbi:hypothetical protein CLV62_101307 [Dysgonomonas alginatilytica]|uniref:Uncharacterized protein n=1 Tax=Dysgonomonas alginatilytica TaxID=1605892 RepID=A0A2V3PWS3_9BACT|nr:hypothetical protein [Dysgonomonas alginatilytica]PXV69038.1 hypothetical protein CLV62_101307 [Dysgonomonas alginatilytica]